MIENLLDEAFKKKLLLGFEKELAALVQDPASEALQISLYSSILKQEAVAALLREEEESIERQRVRLSQQLLVEQDKFRQLHTRLAQSRVVSERAKRYNEVALSLLSASNESEKAAGAAGEGGAAGPAAGRVLGLALEEADDDKAGNGLPRSDRLLKSHHSRFLAELLFRSLISRATRSSRDIASRERPTSRRRQSHLLSLRLLGKAGTGGLLGLGVGLLPLTSCLRLATSASRLATSSSSLLAGSVSFLMFYYLAIAILSATLLIASLSRLFWERYYSRTKLALSSRLEPISRSSFCSRASSMPEACQNLEADLISYHY